MEITTIKYTRACHTEGIGTSLTLKSLIEKTGRAEYWTILSGLLY